MRKLVTNPQNFLAAALRTQFCIFCIQYCSCYNAKALFFTIRAEGAKIFGIFTLKWNFCARQQQPFILKWNSQLLSGISPAIFMHSQLSGIPLKCESSVPYLQLTNADNKLRDSPKLEIH